MAFTHLHVHTEYSLLDGASRIDDIVARGQRAGDGFSCDYRSWRYVRCG